MGKNPKTFRDYVPDNALSAGIKEALLSLLGTVGECQKEYAEFWRATVPNLDEETGLFPGLQAVRLKPSGFEVPWAAYCEWLRTLNDEQFNELIEDLVSIVEACRVMSGVHELLTVNEAYNFVRWLPEDLANRVDKEYFHIIESTWETFSLSTNLDPLETAAQLAYMWKSFHYTKETGHPLMYDPFGYDKEDDAELSEEDLDKLSDDELTEAEEELDNRIDRRVQYYLGWHLGCSRYFNQIEGEPLVFKDTDGYTIVRTKFYFVRIKYLGDGTFYVNACHGKTTVKLGDTNAEIRIRPKDGYVPLVPLDTEGKHGFLVPEMVNYPCTLTVYIHPLEKHIDITL